MKSSMVSPSLQTKHPLSVAAHISLCLGLGSRICLPSPGAEMQSREEGSVIVLLWNINICQATRSYGCLRHQIRSIGHLGWAHGGTYREQRAAISLLRVSGRRLISYTEIASITVLQFEELLPLMRFKSPKQIGIPTQWDSYQSEPAHAGNGASDPDQLPSAQGNESLCCERSTIRDGQAPF